MAKVQRDGWPRFRKKSGRGSEKRVAKVQRDGWPRFRGRWVAKVQGEVGGQGSGRQVAMVSERERER